LVVLGHSLGAGTAVVYTLLFRQRNPEITVRCHAFGCPAVASTGVWKTESARDITAYVLQDDIVPRLSLDTVTHFQRVLAWVSAHRDVHVFRRFPVLLSGAADHFQFVARQITSKFKRPVTLLPPPTVIHLRTSSEDFSEMTTVLAGAELFSQLVFSARMLTDHFPWHYETAFNTALSNYGTESSLDATVAGIAERAASTS